MTKQKMKQKRLWKDWENYLKNNQIKKFDSKNQCQNAAYEQKNH